MHAGGRLRHKALLLPVQFLEHRTTYYVGDGEFFVFGDGADGVDVVGEEIAREKVLRAVEGVSVLIQEGYLEGGKEDNVLRRTGMIIS